MGQAETLAALEVWMDAGLAHRDWSGPLTWSLGVTGATALAFSRKTPEGPFEILGASAGAPLEFLNLCRDLGEGPSAAGAQERHVAGLGRLAWSTVTSASARVALFGLYHGQANLAVLNEITFIGEKCISSRLRVEEGRSAASAH